MAAREWTIELDGQRHLVAIDSDTGSGTHTVSIDGEVIEPVEVCVGENNPKTRLQFIVGNLDFFIIVTPKPSKFVYTLLENTESATTGGKMKIIESTPVWVWIFIAACMLTPLIHSKAIAFLLAATTGLGCYGLGKNAKLDTLARVAGCLMITLVGWGAVILIAIVNAGFET